MNNGRHTDEPVRDPETLEREIRRTRADMNDTLEALERKLTVGQLLDQCLRFFGKSGTQLGSSLGHAAKENPVPMLLTVTGIAWMMFGRGGSERSYRQYGSPEVPFDDEGTDVRGDYGSVRQGLSRRMANAAERVSDIGQGLSERASNVGERVSEGMSHVGEKLSERASNVGDTIRSTAASTRSRLTQTKDSARDAVSETYNRATVRAQTQFDRAREGFKSVVEEQPLVLGALGLAIGAAIGAALPSTEQEDQLMGDMRDKTIAKAKEAGAAVYEKGRETARQTVENAVQR